MSPTQTKTEYLLDRIAERLGVPKLTEDQEAAFASAPADTAADMLALLADPAASKKRLDEHAAARADARQAQADEKRARAELAKLYTEIADAQERHDQKITNELAAHTTAMDRRLRDVELREKAVADRERELANAQAVLKADRDALDKKRDAIRKAAA